MEIDHGKHLHNLPRLPRGLIAPQEDNLLLEHEPLEDSLVRDGVHEAAGEREPGPDDEEGLAQEGVLVVGAHKVLAYLGVHGVRLKLLRERQEGCVLCSVLDRLADSAHWGYQIR